MFCFSETKLQKQHDFAVQKLTEWRKKINQDIIDLQKKLKEFSSKERMSEAEQYKMELTEIGNTLEFLKDEVDFFHLLNFLLTTKLFGNWSESD